jgi:hypothetical protein
MGLDVDRLWEIGETIADLRSEDLRLVRVDRRLDPPAAFPDLPLRRPEYRIESRGAPVGQLSTAIHEDGGSLLLEIRRLLLHPKAQGRGTARTIQAHLDRRLPGLGIEHITLDASGAGSYAWARLGYDFDLDASRGGHHSDLDDERLRRQVRADLLGVHVPHEWPIIDECGGGVVPASAVESAARLLDSLTRSGPQAAEFVERTRAFVLGTDDLGPPSPDEIALFGRGTTLEGLPPDSWIGRELMIRGSWSGVKRLPG